MTASAQGGSVERALGLLSMTTCPYFDHEGTCDRGCHQEPECITGAPLKGWVGEAIDVLSLALDQERGG